MKTAAIIVCTSRMAFALQTLAALDAQDAELDIFLVCNSNDVRFRSELILVALDMRKQVTFLALSAQHANIGIGVNCGLWHALNSSRTYDGCLKIDDDIDIPPDAIDAMWLLCDETNIVALAPYAKGDARYGDPDSIRSKKVQGVVTSLYGACVLIPSMVLTACGYWGETCPRGGDTDYSIRAHHTGHDVTYHPDRVCLHLGAKQPTEGIEDKHKARRMLPPDGDYRITLWNDAATRAALLLDRFGWAN